jgi:Fe-S cluster biogenesis protein NfuA
MNNVLIRIEQALATARPYLRADDGDVEFVRFRDDIGVLELRLHGTCVICPLSKMTLRAGIERIVMHNAPEVKRVEQVS